MRRRSVIITPPAQRDIFRLRAFLKSKNPDAALRAVIAIRDAASTLDILAERGSPLGEGLRELPVGFGHYGYVIRYSIGEDEVAVTRIFHGLEDRFGFDDGSPARSTPDSDG